jgi:hypothetical protein
VRELHPELGYIGTPSFARGFLVFVVCGLIAGASAVTIFKAEPDPDPMSAMALAPPEARSAAARPTSPDSRIGKSIFGNRELVRETPKTGAIKSRCEKSATEHLGGDCIVGQIHRARSIPALNERPAIAAAPIGHRVDPAVLPPEPAAPVVAVQPKEANTPVPAETPVVATLAEDTESAIPAETPSAVPTPLTSLPAVVSAKTRGRHRERAQRHGREHREYASTPRYHREQREYASTPRYYSNRQVYQSAGYARLW